MTQIRVRITAQDISDGIPRLPAFCPLALALQRQLKEHVSVRYSFALIHHSDRPGTRLWLSPRAEDFARRFDAKFPVRPQTVTLTQK